MKKIKESDFIKDAIMKQLKDAGWEVAYEDLIGDWYVEYYTTKEQESAFRDWFITAYHKAFKVSKAWAERVYSGFIFTYGLTIK